MTTARYATALTGGAAGALDAKTVATLTDGDIAWVATGSSLYVYKFDAAATDAESSPSVIRPDDYATAGVWKLQTVSQTTGPKAIQVFATAGTHTYNPTPGATVAVAEVVGGGGEGADGATQASGGGGGGGYSRKWLSLSGITSVTVTVGAGGSGGTTTGNNGGTSSFGAHCSATGGAGSVNTGSSYNVGGAGGVGSGGDVNLTGSSGRTSTNIGGDGGESIFGGAGRGKLIAGTAGVAPGAGGAGGAGSGTYAGGNGAAGIVIVTEY